MQFPAVNLPALLYSWPHSWQRPASSLAAALALTAAAFLLPPPVSTSAASGQFQIVHIQAALR